MKKIKNRIIQLIVLLKCIYYGFYCKMKKIEMQDIWLISERGDEARDNRIYFL